MPDYYYRGTSLSSAITGELGSGRIDGYTANIYRGDLDTVTPQATVARETPVDQLPWWTPKGEDRPYLTETQGITGGLTQLIGTAVGFSTGVPVVLYLRESGLNGTPTPVRYGYDYFDSIEGAAQWVYGESVTGEVRTVEDGLIGLTTTTADGPVIWEWGQRDLNESLRVYEDEREALVLADHIDIAPACAAVAIVLEGRRTPAQALATFDGYHAGFGSDGTDISRWSETEQLEQLHEEVQSAVPATIPDLWTINLTSTIPGRVNDLQFRAFDYAYQPGRGRLNHGETPDHLLGR